MNRATNHAYLPALALIALVSGCSSPTKEELDQQFLLNTITFTSSAIMFLALTRYIPTQSVIRRNALIFISFFSSLVAISSGLANLATTQHQNTTFVLVISNSLIIIMIIIRLLGIDSTVGARITTLVNRWAARKLAARDEKNRLIEKKKQEDILERRTLDRTSEIRSQHKQTIRRILDLISLYADDIDGNDDDKMLLDQMFRETTILVEIHHYFEIIRNDHVMLLEIKDILSILTRFGHEKKPIGRRLSRIIE